MTLWLFFGLRTWFNAYCLSIVLIFQSEAEKLLTIHVLTGAKREEQGTINNRFVIHRTESVVYAAELEVASGAYGMSREGLINNFHMIVQDWNTGEA